MAFPMEIQKVISDYCNNHLPEEKWYENEFDFIQDEDLKKRIIAEFKAARVAYKLFECVAATGDKGCNILEPYKTI